MAESQIQNDRVQDTCNRIGDLLKEGERGAWMVGDLLVELSEINVGGKPLTLKQVQQRYLSEFSYSYLAQLRSTALEFPEHERHEFLERGATWYECDIARRSRANCIKAKIAEKDEPLGNFVDFILKNKGRRRLNPREIVKQRIEQAALETRQRRAFSVEQIRSSDDDWTANCHHRSCLDVMNDMDPESVDLCWADPPYGAFFKTRDGSFQEPETKGLEAACDNKTRDEAVALTLGLIEGAARVLKPTGKIVLWQASTEPDRPEVISLLHQLGFDAILPMYWKKKQPQPSDFRIPFSHETERILVAARSREALWTPLGGKGRTDVITDDVIAKVIPDPMEYEEAPPSRTFYRDVAAGKAQYGDRHFFEKPLNLCKFFLEKLTLPGDTVIDVCGCTGSMIEACIEMDRRWVYCETHETNFNLGVSRIGEAMKQKFCDDDSEHASSRA